MIKILCFAYLRDKIGEPSIQIEKDNMTIGEIKNYMAEKYNIPTCLNMLSSINEEYADNDAIATSGDVVALIPPLGGGI